MLSGVRWGRGAAGSRPFVGEIGDLRLSPFAARNPKREGLKQGATYRFALSLFPSTLQV